MPDLTDKIQKLSDYDAIDLLRRFFEGVGAPAPRRDEGEAAIALAQAEQGATPDDGAAARLALCLLAADSKYTAPIQAMLTNPPAKRMLIDPFTGTILAGGLLFALQTHVEFHKNTDGTWSLKLIKKPTKDGMLNPLIKKIAALMGKITGIC